MGTRITAYDDVTNEPTDLLGVPVLTSIYDSPLAPLAQDTNDAQIQYQWANGIDDDYLVSDVNNERFLAKKVCTLQLHPWVAVTDATANDRASFYIQLRLFDDQGNPFDVRNFASTYIRDDNASYDNGANGGGISLTLQAGYYFEVWSIRFSSQDANDDNPADTNISSFKIDAWGII